MEWSRVHVAHPWDSRPLDGRERVLKRHGVVDGVKVRVKA